MTAAVAAALIGSRLGVQGTLIGAAVTAVVAGMVSQFATFWPQRTHAGLQLVISAPRAERLGRRRRRAGRGRVRGERGPGRRYPGEAWPKCPLGLALGGVALSAVVTFAITMGVLTVAESAAGRSRRGLLDHRRWGGRQGCRRAAERRTSRHPHGHGVPDAGARRRDPHAGRLALTAADPAASAGHHHPGSCDDTRCAGHARAGGDVDHGVGTLSGPAAGESGDADQGNPLAELVEALNGTYSSALTRKSAARSM